MDPVDPVRGQATAYCPQIEAEGLKGEEISGGFMREGTQL